ncbi:inositol monophosphatase family protein [Halobacillus amylolyticus]|uniref:inositol-phosphate phosphatase n=1 Tax=Halobacillus amylolyticus TaxID=2932259 RepID=A0ABY4HDN5_9BACI|nr:inositol monophosphatase family protein [Halobacillus amylolyticus]UOR12967.1 inositol monophosphatase family protein [Halobacillus amylolyticus]
MDKIHRNQLYTQAKEWVLEAGQRIRSKIDDPRTIETKSNANDLVTEMDQETEQFFAEKIRETYEDHLVFGEEGFGDEIKSLDGTIWIIDPIDGTMNFVHQKRNFAISVGIYQDGIGEIGIIYNVMEDTIYTAKRGEGAYKNNRQLAQLPEESLLKQAIFALNTTWMLPENPYVSHQGIHELVKTLRSTRTYGSAALEFAFVAEGVIDGYLTMTLMPWDIAAGMVILKEVGGTVTTAGGQDVDMLNKTTILACHPMLHDEVLETFVDLKK